MKTFCLLLGLFAAASAFQRCGKMGRNHRIINGVDAGHGEFPWLISLRMDYFQTGDWGHHCGGALITNQWVLTAAHCIVGGLDVAAYQVRVGEWYLEKIDGTEKDFDVAQIRVHKRWNKVKGKVLANDIALIKLKQPVDFSGPYAGPVCLPPAGKDYRGAKNCVVAGWGMISTDPHRLANRLQKLTGSVWTAEALLKAYPDVSDFAVGFGGTGEWDTCQCDSGGPLVCQNGQGSWDVTGIVSWGPSDCQGYEPGVLTEVAGFRDWIFENSGGAA